MPPEEGEVAGRRDSRSVDAATRRDAFHAGACRVLTVRRRRHPGSRLRGRVRRWAEERHRWHLFAGSRVEYSSAGPGRRDRRLRRGAVPSEPARCYEGRGLKQLAGPLDAGSSDVQGELSSEIEGMINEDGSFWIADRRANATQAPGTMKIVDGGVQYDSGQVARQDDVPRGLDRVGLEAARRDEGRQPESVEPTHQVEVDPAAHEASGAAP